ncbi:MAG TPA: hypothetical protein VJU83_10340 [Burkholderiales bacterium]|nr:hypothetical protein [Burkholderiales bacterium]
MRIALLLVLSFLLAACESTPKPPAPPPPAGVPKVGIVGLVQTKTERAINQNNWKTAILGVVRNEEGDENANVSKTVYEVTVFFDAGQQEVIRLDQDPQLKPGQRVRVTGNKIEVLNAR